MNEKDLKIGKLLKNFQGKFAKIVDIRNEVYGLTGWTDRKSAEDMAYATIFVNIYRLEQLGVEIVGKAKDSENDPKPPAENGNTNGDPVTPPTEDEMLKMNVATLTEYAKSVGIEFTDTKAVTVAAIMAARNANK